MPLGRITAPKRTEVISAGGWTGAQAASAAARQTASQREGFRIATAQRRYLTKGVAVPIRS